MENTQNYTKPTIDNSSTPAEIVPAPIDDVLKINQQKWIDFNAVGGLITESDGALKPMTITAFAAAIGVERKTLYNWKNSIPNFWERVKQRRLELGSQARLQKVYTGLYLKASQGVPEAVKLYLQIFDDWKPPAQEQKIQLSNGLADLVARKKLELEHSRKIIDATPAAGNNESNNS